MLLSLDYVLNDLKTTEIEPPIISVDLEETLNFSTLTIPFIKNQGQISPEIKYYANTFAGTISVTDEKLSYHSIIYKDDTATSVVISEKFLDGKLSPKGQIPSDTVVNYFKGDKENWKNNISTYDEIYLGSTWDDIEVSLKAHGNNVEKIFTVNPGGNISDIQLSFDGIQSLSLDDSKLSILTQHGTTKFSEPISFQIINGEKIIVDSSYKIINDNTYGFVVDSYRTDLPIVIDPLIASTFVGGGSTDDARGLVIDSSGNIFISGRAASAFPTTSATFLSKFGSSGTGDGQFNISHLIAIDNSGNIYVTDNSNHRVQKFDSSGNFLLKFGTSGTGTGQLKDPSGIAIDSSGNIYVADFTNHRVQKFNSSGTFLSMFGFGVDDGTAAFQTCTSSCQIGISGSGDGQFSFPHGVTIDSSDNLYVAGGNNHRVQKFDSSGTFLSKFGTSGTAEGQFNFPGDIAFDSSGNIYVSDINNYRVQKFNSSGTFLSKFGTSGTGNGQFDRPTDIKIDSSGNLYVADQNNHRVQKLNSSGVYVTKWGSLGTGDGEFNKPTGIAIDSSDNIYVTDLNNNRVQRFTVVGTVATFESTFGSSGTGDGKFSFPTGIVHDSSKDIYISDNGNHRIQKFSVGPYDPTSNASGNIFISKLSSDLSSMVASTFIAPGSSNWGRAIAVDGSGNIFVTGQTSTSNFPTTAGAFQTSHVASNAWVSKFDSRLSTLIASTYLGGSDIDSPRTLAIDSSGNIYIAGLTQSSDFPTAGTPYDSSLDGTTNDGFISVLNNDLTTLTASTYVGGTAGNTEFQDLVLDSDNNIFVTGKTTSTSYPTTTGAYDTSHNGFADIVVSKFTNNLSTLSASTFVGGTSNPGDIGYGIAIDSVENVFVAGLAQVGFPATGGAYDTTIAGSDAVVFTLSCNLALTDSNCFSASPISAIFDGATYTELDGAKDVAIVTIDSRTYALITATDDDGVQIIDISTPSAPTAVAAITDDVGGFTELDGAKDVTTVVIGSSTYALVTANADDGVQIIDISTPSAPTAVAAITDEVGGFTALDGANGITTVVIGSNTYALVTAAVDNGLQIIDITTPSAPTAVAAVFDGATYTELEWANDVTTVVIGSSTYALVASNADDGIQIINITTPSSPSATSAVTDGVGGFTALDGAFGITTIKVGNSTYALVSSIFDEAVQIINITTPSSPTAAAAVFDGVGGFTGLGYAYDITTVTIGTEIYAIVTGGFDDAAVQIIDVSTPTNPTPTKAVFDEVGGFTSLDYPKGVDTVVLGGTVYVVVGANRDDGVQIFSIGPVTTTVAEGESESVSVEEGETASFEYSETEETVTETVSLAVTLPTNTSGKITVETAIEDDLEQGTLLATAADITAPCTNSCTISFTVADTILTTLGLDPTTANIYHDSNENELIEVGENIATTRDTTTISGSTIFSGEADFTSKFAVGGVKALATGAVGGGGGSFAPTFVSSPTSFSFGGILDPNGNPIEVNQIIYEITGEENQVEKQTVETGIRNDFVFTLFEDSGSDGIPHFEFLTNLTEKSREYYDSDTYIIYDKNDELLVKDPHGLFKNTSYDMYSLDNFKVTITISITFDKEMSESDIYLKTWDSGGHSRHIKLLNAIEVIPGEAESELMDVEIDPEPGVDDVVIDPEPGVDDVVIDPEPGIDDVIVPVWIKNSAEWWNEGQINDETFVQSIEFLIHAKIIDVPIEANVSINPDKINTNIKFQEIEEKIMVIPDWIKNTAGWWSEGLLSDEEFVNSIKFLLENETIVI